MESSSVSRTLRKTAEALTARSVVSTSSIDFDRVLLDFTSLTHRELSMLVSPCYEATWRGFLSTTPRWDSGGRDGSHLAEMFVHRESNPDSSVTTAFFPFTQRVIESRGDALNTWFTEFFLHFSNDSDDIRRSFGVQLPLMEARGGFSDLHNGGKQVLLCRFRCGRQLVYKPRSLSGEATWNRLCSLLNEAVPNLSLPVLTVLDRGGHGWMEYAPHEPVAEAPVTASISALRSMSAQVAVLDRLGCTDAHNENLILTTQGPVLVDCETLLSPAPRAVLHEEETVVADCAGEAVLRTSAIAGWIRLSNGGWRSIAPVHNLFQQLRSGGTPASELFSTIDSGYHAGLSALAKAVRNAGSARRLLVWIGADRLSVRYIARPTSFYSRLLTELAKPATMHSPAARATCLDKLRHWTTQSPSHLVERIVEAEIHDIQNWDVPYFTLASRSNQLFDGSGNEIGTLGGRDPFQRAVEGISDSSSYTDETRSRTTRAALQRFDSGSASPGWMVDGAIGSILRRTARTCATDCLNRHVAPPLATPMIIGASHCPLTGRTIVGPLSSGLYSGLSGVLLMYAACHRVLGGEEFLVGAHQVLDAMRSESAPSATETWLGFAGAVSDLYALALSRRITPLEGCEALLHERIERLKLQRSSISGVRRPDLVGGLSGALLALTAVAELSDGAVGSGSDELAHDLYTRLGRHLIPLSGGAAISGDGFGLAHGTTGPYFAGLRAAHRLGDERVTEACSTALITAGTELLLSADREAGYGSVSWCRGIAGLASALMEAERITGNRYPLTELAVERLLSSTHRTEGQCLYCGTGSIADVLASVEALPERFEGIASTFDRVSMITAWLAGPQNPRIPGAANYLGLMQGRSGFVYTLLRLVGEEGRRLPSPSIMGVM